jgi:hypothetical protein
VLYIDFQPVIKDYYLMFLSLGLIYMLKKLVFKLIPLAICTCVVTRTG